MKAKDILNTKMTTLVNASGYVDGRYTQKDLTLQQIISLGNIYKDKIMELRELGYGTDQYKENKKKFPCYTPCGTFEYKKVNDSSITSLSNIIAIDIDKKDNTTDLDNIREEIFNLPYVIAVLKSISGLGLYALVLVENGNNTTDYYSYLAKLWNAKYGLNIDQSCKNLSRKRFISYDKDTDNYLKSEDTEITPWRLYEKHHEEHRDISLLPSITPCKKTDETLVEKTIEYLVDHGFSIDNFRTDKKRSVWFYVGCDFSYFTKGLDYFIKFSQNTSEYNDDIAEITKKYNECTCKTNIDDIAKKYCGIAKTIYGKNWMNIVKTPSLI